MPVTVNEVTVIKPNLLRVEVLDGEVTLNELEAYDASSQSYLEDAFTWYTVNGKQAHPVGPNKDYVHYANTDPDAYLDRAAAQVAGNYGTIGGQTVSAVYYKVNAKHGYERDGGLATRGSQMRHYLYLSLSGNLAEGTHTIDFPAGTGLADYSFTYDTHTTRCAAIHVNQHGWRPNDSKYAHLSQWIPGYGTNGEIDIVTDLSLSKFQVIDEDGNEVYSGTITPRKGPTDAEASYSLSDVVAGAGRQRYIDTGQAPVTITNISAANPTVVTYSGADVFSNGDIIRIESFVGSGFTNLFNEYWLKVASLDTATNTFQITTTADAAIDSTGATYTSGGLIYHTWSSNSSGTYVAGMDFSAFVPSVGGTFRLRIPGLGVSDPFKIDNAAHWKAAEIYAQGEYHHRMGIAIDGRFGFERPLNFRSGQNSQTIYETLIPYGWTNETANSVANPLSYQVIDQSPYITTTEITGWGGWHDAGDWDSRLEQVYGSVWLMLVVYSRLTSAQRAAMDFGLPKSSEIFGSAWAAIDAEGDLLHSAIWGVESYRQLQKGTGAVSAGFNAADIFFGEPSWLHRGQIYAYYPDQLSTFAFVTMAAKLAKVLSDLGYTTLASTYQTAAEDAWDWAESIYQNTGGARDTHYADTKTAMISGGYSEAQFNANVSSELTYAYAERRNAAASMFALTGSSTYSAIVEAAWDAGPWDVFGSGIWPAFDYSQATGANASYKSAMEAAIIAKVDAQSIAQINASNSYKHLSIPTVTTGFGRHSGNQEVAVDQAILAHILDGGDEYKNALADCFGYILGGNQTEQSWTQGLGVRNTEGILHSDWIFQGGTKPTGINIYGPRGAPENPPLNLIFFNFGAEDLSFTYDIIAEGTSPEENSIVEPPRYAWPWIEALWENRLAIEWMEYTVQQGVFPQYSGAVYLHALNDNTQTTYETYTGATDMLVTTSANAIVTDGSIEQATSIEAGVRVSWRGLTLDLDAATYTVTPVI